MSDSNMLLPRQVRFVDEYLVDRNVAAAAVRAGYSERSAFVMGARLLRQDEVQKAVAARSSKVASKLNVTREDCIKGLIEAYKVARSTRDGRAMVGAIRELNRMCGFYAPMPACAGHPDC